MTASGDSRQPSETAEQQVRRIQARADALVDRTTRLHRLTAHLSVALRLEDASAIVIDEGASALDALSAGLWRVDHAARRLELLRTINYPDAALAHVAAMPLVAGTPVTDAVLQDAPIWLSSRADYETRYPESSTRTRSMEPPEAYATAALPVSFDGVALGVLAFTFKGDRRFDDDDRVFLMMLALHCAQAFERTRLYEAERTARAAAEAAHERSTFLVLASALLGGSLDYETTLRNVAALAVPRIGDWCGVELVDELGGTKQVAVAHVDPAKVALAHELRRRYPPDPNATTGVPNVLRTGKSELYPEITDAMLVAGAVDEDHLRISRDLGLSSAMLVPIKDRGVIVGVLSFITAGGARRYSVEDLAMAEQLAERAGAAIGNAKLYDQATKAIRHRDEFVLIAGHELRTPLAALRLHHEALAAIRDDTPMGKIRERAQKLVRQSDRLSTLVDDLLDVSKIAAGRLTLELTHFDLAALVRDVCDRMREAFERASSKLSVELAPVLGNWDRSRVEQVITNLLTNALKYGKGTQISVRLTPGDHGAVLAVSDGGIGIAEHDQARIFERFERAVSPRNFGGLGLGLWITSQLVEAHGGTIRVTSRLGEGATFEVTLPVRRDELAVETHA